MFSLASKAPRVFSRSVLNTQLRCKSTFTPLSEVASVLDEFMPKQSSFDTTKTPSQETLEGLFSKDLPQSTEMLQRMEMFIMGLQKRIVGHLEDCEASCVAATEISPSHTTINNIPLPVTTPATKFQIDRSSRDPKSGMSGGGVVSVLQNGRVFEKAGVNTSVICGQMPLSRLHNMRADHSQLNQLLEKNPEAASQKFAPFAVAGISLVLHPHSPHLPTTHANYRMFQIKIGDEYVWWFGGGSDLTPTYTSPTDYNSKHFHSILKHSCDETQKEMTSDLKIPDMYAHVKKWCDEYFYLPHRGETRGIGGIFYDDFDTLSTGLSQEQLFKFVTSLGDHFPASYFPLIKAGAAKPYTEEQKRFQQLRRGRYVEFNVMYDRGTKFGLEMPSNAHIRTEAILMSLPLTARYEYMHTPAPGSPEAVTLDILRKPIQWL